MADRFVIEDKGMQDALRVLSQRVKAPIYPKVLTGMYREGLRIARSEYKRVIPQDTGLTRRRGLTNVIRKRRGYPTFAAVGPETTRGRPGIRIHWTDEGTRVRFRRSGGSTGSISPANYVRPMIQSIASRVLQQMRSYVAGAAAAALRSVTTSMRSASSRGRGR